MAQHARQVLAGRRILIVEDEYYLADDLARALSAHGATVHGPVGTLADAQTLLASSEAIDAGVVDLRLHDEKAIAIADVLQERGIPFVLATGYEQAMTPERHRGATHLDKPYDLERVVEILAGFFA